MDNHIVTEVWKPVLGFEGRYEVSDLGRVRAVSPRSVQRHKGMTILKQNVSNTGYLRVAMKDAAFKCNMRSVHTLVLTAFSGPKPTRKHQCNHKDGDKANNAPSNLEWVTMTQNMRHSVDVLRQRRGETHVNSKLTDAQAMEIKRRAIAGEAQGDIASDFGVTRPLVSMIKTGYAWKHLE